jgi:uncharacterized protein (DUF302 family)
MTYHISKLVSGDFDETVERTMEVLQENGFGVLTTIDVQATLKAKINADFRPYVILGACNPGLAHKALLAESRIGTMLPCNVIVQQHDDGTVEVSAVDPMASMQAIENEALGAIASQVRETLQKVVDTV